MSHEEYYHYLWERIWEIRKTFPNPLESKALSPVQLLVFDKVASPYHYWLGNRAVMDVPKPPPSSGSPSTEGKGTEMILKDGHSSLVQSPPNLAEKEGASIGMSKRECSEVNLVLKASDIRVKARAAIKRYMETHEKTLPSEASLDLWQLGSTYAQGKSIYKALDVIPDIELVNWNSKHGVFM